MFRSDCGRFGHIVLGTPEFSVSFRYSRFGLFPMFPSHLAPLAGPTAPIVNALLDDLEGFVDEQLERTTSSPEGRFIVGCEADEEHHARARHHLHSQILAYKSAFLRLGRRTEDRLYFESPGAAKALATYLNREEAALRQLHTDDGADLETVATGATVRLVSVLEGMAATRDPLVALGALMLVGMMRPVLAGRAITNAEGRGWILPDLSYARTISITEASRAVDLHGLVRTVVDERPSAADEILAGMRQFATHYPRPLFAAAVEATAEP